MPAAGDACSPEAKAPRIEPAELKEKLIAERQTYFQPKLKFAKLTENATAPTRGSKQAAGFDLYR